jgi:hypothetical protein
LGGSSWRKTRKSCPKTGCLFVVADDEEFSHKPNLNLDEIYTLGYHLSTTSPSTSSFLCPYLPPAITTPMTSLTMWHLRDKLGLGHLFFLIIYFSLTNVSFRFLRHCLPAAPISCHYHDSNINTVPQEECKESNDDD